MVIFKRLLASFGFLLISGASQAHFGMLIPEVDNLSPSLSSTKVTVAFAHPMQATGMTMQKPQKLYAVANGKKHDLMPSLKASSLFGKSAFQAHYCAKRPELIQIVLEPTPYWEAAEEKFIVHFTKTYLPMRGEEAGWESPVGLPAEIVPLTRPFGNWARTIFQGKVIKDGKPVKHCPVEIEYFNRDGKRHVPNDFYVTQVVLTDDAGVFTASVPWGGWWGFAALTDGDKKIVREGKPRDVELGAVLWSYFEEP